MCECESTLIQIFDMFVGWVQNVQYLLLMFVYLWNGYRFTIIHSQRDYGAHKLNRELKKKIHRNPHQSIEHFIHAFPRNWPTIHLKSIRMVKCSFLGCVLFSHIVFPRMLKHIKHLHIFREERKNENRSKRKNRVSQFQEKWIVCVEQFDSISALRCRLPKNIYCVLFAVFVHIFLFLNVVMSIFRKKLRQITAIKCLKDQHNRKEMTLLN